jgi:branched-chain amino acid aminotransferase
MKESKYIWFNGQLVPWNEAQVHVMSHALHYGSSVFEGMRCYKTESGRALFRLECHTRRLLNSAKLYRMPVKFTESELNAAQVDLIKQNDLISAYIRPLIFRGTGSIAVDPGDACKIEVIIAAFEFGAYLGKEGLENGIDTCVSSWQRVGSATNPALSKAGGHYLNAYLVGEEARRNGFDEGISVNARGLISEGSAENLFLIRDGIIYTPPLSAAILGGITRHSAMVLAEELGYQVIEQDMPREMLYLADEIFFTGTAAEVTPVRSVDRLDVGNGKPGPITRAIQDAFFGLFSGKTEDKWGWLTHV